MIKIINKTWDYRFFEWNNKFYIYVMRDSVAVFEINIELNDDDMELSTLFP